MPGPADPARDLGGVEAHEAPDLDVEDASLGDLASDVSDDDAEVVGELLDGKEIRQGLGAGIGRSLGYGGASPAATAVGRMAAAAEAVELGYAIEADPGPSGRLGGWAITGIPATVCEAHSTRSAQITAAVGADASYAARSLAARAGKRSSPWKTGTRAKGSGGPGSRGGNWRLDTIEDARDYAADHPQVYGGMRVSGELVIVSFTSGLDEHLQGLRASVEHPELVRVERAEYPVAKLEADIRQVDRRLWDDPRKPFNEGRPGHVQLRAPFAALAAELHQEYGPSLEITVGHKPFPAARIGDRQPCRCRPRRSRCPASS